MDIWQKCPVCNGTGTQLTANFSRGTCHVCQGHGIIGTVTGTPPQGPKTVVGSSTTTEFKWVK